MGNAAPGPNQVRPRVGPHVVWLGAEDSNLYWRSQSPLSYR